MFYAGLLLSSLVAFTPMHQHRHFFPNSTFSVKWYNNATGSGNITLVESAEYTCGYLPLSPYNVTINNGNSEQQLGSYANQCGGMIYNIGVGIPGHFDKYYCGVVLRVDLNSIPYEWDKGPIGTETYCSNSFGNSSTNANISMYYSTSPLK